MAIHRAIFAFCSFAVLTLLGVAAADAHAELTRAAPEPGGAVSTAPSEVVLTFSEKLEPTFSSVVVRNSVGKRVDKIDSHLDKQDRTVIRASLQSLTPGIYIVEWRALTADTHKAEGAFIFRVGE